METPKELARQKCYDALATARLAEREFPDNPLRADMIQVQRKILNEDLRRVAYTGRYDGTL